MIILRSASIAVASSFLATALVLPQYSRSGGETHSDKMADALSRGMWIWNSDEVLDPTIEIHNLISGAQAAEVTDLFLYTAPESYTSRTSRLSTFITNATAAGLRVWGLDGDRGYFADAGGPAMFYNGIKNLIAYNSGVPTNARFFGFQADNEPQDHGNYRGFHNGIADTVLSKKPGSGVWQSTQAQDREMLMCNWLSMHQTAERLLHAQGLRFGVAMPWWTEDYEGGELMLSFPEAASKRQGVMKHMMGMVDDYVVMSYNTDPANAVARVHAQAAYASSLPASRRPRVYASVEVTPGIGVNVSYADTKGKCAKAVVLQDVGTITKALRHLSAFSGVAIHHWSAWQAMPP